ncbi:CHAT domain-containing protein [Spirulina sp. CCNP1310]|uniref:CHAT domain-containing protein n=1 Tax=Spirulina sp. CCNP1310 TaxID=3110249 RepID=UPI002B207810|nr:CHAT domain-containing protein [Spirulina sp. CCNP1310]MEA5420787.1 CHAT domain-containing protein [Spirulina sp. CCNP1310]
MKFFGKVARRLGAFLGQGTAQNTIPAEYKAFLREALRLTDESGGNPSVVYPFLERQQDKLNEDLIALIPAFATGDNIIDLFNFANLVQQFPQGQRAINLEIAIAICIKALDFFDRQDNPEAWAMTQHNLGNAYYNRLRGERGENIEEAIRCYQAALEVRTRTAYPEYWAMTQNNLGNAYSNRLRGERGENIEAAIRCYQAALEVYTRTAYAEDWAMTQNNLGTAYSDRLRGERGENMEEAIRCYQAALEVYTPEAFPLKCLQTGRNLGNLAYDRQNWEIAIEGYDNAIRAVEQSRDWATNPQTKQQLIADALPLYGRMIEACFHLQRYEQALLTVERSKARTFTELLHNANRLPQNATPAQIQQYEQLNREIAALQYTLDDQPPTDPTNPQPGHRNLNLPNPAPQTTPLLTLIQQRKTLLAEINDPTFNAFETVKPQLPDFAQLLNPTTAILQWFLPQDPDLGAYAFLITHQNSQTHIHPHRYSPAQRQALDQFNQTYNHDYRQNSWYESLDQRLDHPAQLLDLPQLLTHRPNPCHHLILIPHLYLQLCPLHALTVPIQTATNLEGATLAPLQDCFEKGVRYAPSCQILAYLQNRPRTQPTAPFFAIQNPTQDLHYADVEIDLIRRRFDPAHILKHAAANKPAFEQPTTRAQLHNSEIIHFACHGGFDSTNPLNSALILAGDKPAPLDGERTLTLRDGRRFNIEHQCLTAAEIYRNLKLACRLVILSACETGRLDSRTTDEYIGLANALLYAGSNTVVDTRWCVDDFATAFLTICFYQELNHNQPIPQALKVAQTWFRTTTKADFLDWCAKTLQMSENDIKACRLELFDYAQDPPFAPKRYWAAFSASGLP